ncbi:MAG: hypothetical protein ACF8PN_09105 [Phycisphaerales bacterium]
MSDVQDSRTARTSDLSGLVSEYRSLVSERLLLSDISGELVREHNWNPRAADELIRVVNEYGSFFLRNACAVAIALNIEDGEEGY